MYPRPMANRAVSGRTTAMAGLATTVAATSIGAPRLLLRILGVPPEQATPAAELSLRLFAARNLAVSAFALRGDETAQAMFLPIQGLDQIAWWDLYRRGTLSLRTTLTCAAISGVIIGLGIADHSAQRDAQS